MFTLFLSHNQSFQRKMTLCDLLHKVTWAEVLHYIERHLTECPGMKLSDYKRMLDQLQRMAPERWIMPGLFRFYISPDTPYSREWKDIAHDTISATGYYITDHAFGVPWAVALTTRIEQSGRSPFVRCRMGCLLPMGDVAREDRTENSFVDALFSRQK